MKKTGLICLLVLIFINCSKDDDNDLKNNNIYEFKEFELISDWIALDKDGNTKQLPDSQWTDRQLGRALFQISNIEKIEITSESNANFHLLKLTDSTIYTTNMNYIKKENKYIFWDTTSHPDTIIFNEINNSLVIPVVEFGFNNDSQNIMQRGIHYNIKGSEDNIDFSTNKTIIDHMVSEGYTYDIYIFRRYHELFFLKR
jgi:hypothetical protein